MGFNPRPRAGGDAAWGRRANSTTGFNPRPRAGGDFLKGADGIISIRVSIHAPARGATCSICTKTCK